MDCSINCISKIANFKSTWLSGSEEIQFLGAQRVPSLDSSSVADVPRRGVMQWESELVGKKTSLNFSGTGENSATPMNCRILENR